MIEKNPIKLMSNNKEYFDEADKLRAAMVPLADVLREEGYTPARIGKERHDGKAIYDEYVCPFHADHSPSLQVYRTPGSGHQLPLWSCHSCGAKGKGAVELQMALLRLHEPTENDSDLWYKAMCLLSQRFNLTNDGGKHFLNDFWHRSKNIGNSTSEDSDYKSQAFLRDGNALARTEVDALGKGWPASDGSNAYSPTPEALQEWGTVLREEFGLQSVAWCEFNTSKGRIHEVCTDHYPIFEFRYPGGAIKKYEPLAKAVVDADGNPRPQYKFTWYGEKPKADGLYGDRAVMGALYPTKTKTKTKTDAEAQLPNAGSLGWVVLCSGPRDAINVYMHYRLQGKEVHVAYPHSERAAVDDATMRRLIRLAQRVFVCFDTDRTGREAQRRLCLRYLDLYPLDLPTDLGNLRNSRSGKACKDVSEFLSLYKRGGRKGTYLFDQMLRKAKPLKFWKTTIHRHRTGENKEDITLEERYELDPMSTCLFLKYMGFYAVQTIDPKRKVEKVGGYCIIGPYEDEMVNLLPNQVEVVPADMGMNRARDIMRHFLADYPLTDAEADELLNAIATQRKFTGEALQQGCYRTRLEFDYWNDRATSRKAQEEDYFFFRNTAVRVTATEIKAVPYEQLTFPVNKAAVIDEDFRPLSEEEERLTMLDADINPALSERQEAYNIQRAMQNCSLTEQAQRTVAFTEWVRLNFALLRRPERPIQEWAPVVQWAKRIGEIYWEKAEMGYSLTADEQQRQDMLTIIAMAAIGFGMYRRRTKGMVHFVLFTDYNAQDEQKESGGTGKSTVLDLIRLVSPVCHIIGQTFKRKENFSRNFDKFVDSVDRVIGVDDIRAEVDGAEFNGVTEGLDVKNLYHDEVRIPFENCPKFIISTNKLKFDASKDSTYRRMFLVMISDYFHPANVAGNRRARNYRSEYGKDIIKEATREELRHARHFMMKCLQVFLRVHAVMGDESPMIPLDQQSLSRVQSAGRERAGINTQQFLAWAKDYFASEEVWHKPIAVSELQLSYWLYQNGEEIEPKVEEVQQRTNYKSFLGALEEYCNTSGISLPFREGDNSRFGRRVKTYVHQKAGVPVRYSLSLPRIVESKESVWFYKKGEAVPEVAPQVEKRMGEVETHTDPLPDPLP